MQINNINKLKTYLDLVIREKGLGYYKTARKIGVEYKTLHGFLFDERNITILNLIAICDYCDVDICFKAKIGACKNDKKDI